MSRRALCPFSTLLAELFVLFALKSIRNGDAEPVTEYINDAQGKLGVLDCVVQPARDDRGSAGAPRHLHEGLDVARKKHPQVWGVNRIVSESSIAQHFYIRANLGEQYGKTKFGREIDELPQIRSIRA